VRPLDHAQLVHWDEYLKYEEAQGSRERMVKLFERCIIPCCNYPKYWFNYINYLEYRSVRENEDSQHQNVCDVSFSAFFSFVSLLIPSTSSKPVPSSSVLRAFS
jgi:hypothetical protein